MIRISCKNDVSGVKILFLGYHRHQTKLIDALISDGNEVWHTADKVDDTRLYDLTCPPSELIR